MQKGEPDMRIYLLAFLKVLVLGLIAREHLKTFTTRLLTLPKLSILYPTQAVYRSITSLLPSKPDTTDVGEARETVSYLLEAILTSPPSKQDTQLALYWLPYRESPPTRALPHRLLSSLRSHPTPLAQTFLRLINRIQPLQKCSRFSQINAGPPCVHIALIRR